jgi:cytochrome c
MSRPLPTAALAAALATASLLPAAFAGGDAAHGREVYERCQACHSPDTDRVGPRHRGVVGRKAGSVPGFPYSAALRHAGFVWTEERLDRWLADPQTLVPGQRMGFRLGDPRDRADVIAYLKSLAP